MNTETVELSLHFHGKLDYLHLATGVSRLICKTIKELPESFVDEVELAVNEACTNAIKHATDADFLSRIDVRFRVYETHLVIEISDHGAGFDIESVPQPDFDQHPERGYGLYIIRTIMDEVQYTRGDGFNTLRMKKNLAKA
jgi:serine/threonine-protein kinase RsbW